MQAKTLRVSLSCIKLCKYATSADINLADTGLICLVTA